MLLEGICLASGAMDFILALIILQESGNLEADSNLAVLNEYQSQHTLVT